MIMCKNLFFCFSFGLRGSNKEAIITYLEQMQQE
jgi:hypothetical protein